MKNKYFSEKFVPFKKLLEIRNSNKLYIFNWMEDWILGCYKNYNERLSLITSKKDLQNLNKWWKGCIRTYNKEKENE